MEYPAITKLVRDIPDFPSPGIIFKDITPVLQDPRAFQEVMDALYEQVEPMGADVIVGIESRGFIFGAPLALRMKKGFVPIRKVGKLPYQTLREDYDLEYGTNSVEVHADAVAAGQRVVIVDDLLATGGTASAAARLIEKLGGVVVGFAFVIELDFLHGRPVLGGAPVAALINYS